jgi:hypothetical protein
MEWERGFGRYPRREDDLMLTSRGLGATMLPAFVLLSKRQKTNVPRIINNYIKF